jgi:murein DD-endopeptidase MepM/ murein hydrolase activator NlpD
MHGGQVVMSRIVAAVVLVPVMLVLMLVPVMFAPAVPAGGAPRSVPHGTTGASLPAAPPAARGGAWAWPLPQPHTVTRPFEAPQTRYSAGHRGIDIAAAAGTRVYAAAEGVVSFAGVVAGRPLLSIAHPGDLVWSIEPVQALVANGEHVSVGQQVGMVAVGGHCSNACLHLGVRLHGQYVSPLLLLGGIPRAVLLPLGGD